MKLNESMDINELRRYARNGIRTAPGFAMLANSLSRTELDEFTDIWGAIVTDHIPQPYLEQLTNPLDIATLIGDCTVAYGKKYPSSFHKFVLGIIHPTSSWGEYPNPGEIISNVIEQIKKRVFEPDLDGYIGIAQFNMNVYMELIMSPDTRLGGLWLSSSDIMNKKHLLGAFTKFLVRKTAYLFNEKYADADHEKIPEFICNTIKDTYRYFGWNKLIEEADNIYRLMVPRIEILRSVDRYFENRVLEILEDQIKATIPADKLKRSEFTVDGLPVGVDEDTWKKILDSLFFRVERVTEVTTEFGAIGEIHKATCLTNSGLISAVIIYDNKGNLIDTAFDTMGGITRVSIDDAVYKPYMTSFPTGVLSDMIGLSDDTATKDYVKPVDLSEPADMCAKETAKEIDAEVRKLWDNATSSSPYATYIPEEYWTSSAPIYRQI